MKGVDLEQIHCMDRVLIKAFRVSHVFISPVVQLYSFSVLSSWNLKSCLREYVSAVRDQCYYSLTENTSTNYNTKRRLFIVCCSLFQNWDFRLFFVSPLTQRTVKLDQSSFCSRNKQPRQASLFKEKNVDFASQFWSKVKELPLVMGFWGQNPEVAQGHTQQGGDRMCSCPLLACPLPSPLCLGASSPPEACVSSHREVSSCPQHLPLWVICDCEYDYEPGMVKQDCEEKTILSDKHPDPPPSIYIFVLMDLRGLHQKYIVLKNTSQMQKEAGAQGKREHQDW